jgi:hypothetical protein
MFQFSALIIAEVISEIRGALGVGVAKNKLKLQIRGNE